MIRPRILSLLDGRITVSNLHGHLGGLTDEDVDGDLVERHLLDGIRCVARLVSNCPSVGARSGGIRLMVIDHFLLGHRRRHAVFVSGDIVREEIAPRFVRVGEDIAFGTLRYTRRLDRANVVAFAIVVPCDDLSVHQY